VSRVRDALPQGQTLPDAEWRRRHHALLILLWLHAVALPIFALTQGYGVAHSLLEGAPIALLAYLAVLAGDRKRLASACVSLGLITSSAVLVHIWGGVIEAHFHFFVMVVLLSLYEDWVPFLIAAAYVVLHHGFAGALAPDTVYNHHAAQAHPWRWALIHGGFVVAAGAGAVIAWRLNEDVRRENARALARARESEDQFRSAFDGAPIGMALVGVEGVDDGRFLEVNRALCLMTGFKDSELLERRWDQIADESDQHEECILHCADESEIRVLVSRSIVKDAEGNCHAVVQVLDVTERRRVQEELQFQALHDALTGLPNRRALMNDLEEGMAQATNEEPLLLVLFDLDGFKAYNDSFGHPAGDALLARLGRRLESAVAGHGVGYRMGGDEFCLLAPVGVEGPEPVEAAAAASLCDQGEGFAISASHGSVVLPHDAVDAEQALRRADARLYARKGSRRASAGRQATDALLTALSERNPDLGSHLRDVTDLVAAVADALGVLDEERTPLLQAAALHDVGKVAIPDAILDKPAALDDAEWTFMRTHTLIGERILASAPALVDASEIVRASHERVDGTGYPDGLEGDRIPLGARIVAVCDAYDAMVSNRPYRTAMSREGAIAELRGGAGTQFDAAVVEAFIAALAGLDRSPAASA
jgi:diguanylate cyclase (GGDEF)-like protein/PAS domain S-box-containing protein